MLQIRKNDVTVPIGEKTASYLLFSESFYLFFIETHGRRLGLVEHAGGVRIPVQKD